MTAYQAASTTPAKSPQHWGDAGGPSLFAIAYHTRITIPPKSPIHGGFRGPCLTLTPAPGEGEGEG
jgi:hypothetical protein